MTVLAAIQKSAEFLGKKGVESPRLQAELLLAHLLKLPRLKLYLNFERMLAPAETDTLRELVKRRGQREPLQHIVGSTSFCGYEIAVNRRALVPRPETELLAELGWQFLLGGRCQTRARITPSAPAALDFGTGTGCIAIALAAKCPNAKIAAPDISADALALAKENAAANKVAERIEFLPRRRLRRADGARDESAASRPRSLTSSSAIRPTFRSPKSPRSSRKCVTSIRAPRSTAARTVWIFIAAGDGSRPFLKPDGKFMLEFGDGQAAAIRRFLKRKSGLSKR